MKICPVLTLVALIFAVHFVYAQEEIAVPVTALSEGKIARSGSVPPMDIVVVMDNSGSMKKNDPAFLTREVVTNFLNVLSEDSRIGFIVFAEESRLTMPLTSVSEDGIREKVTETTTRLDYRGLYTNTPAAIANAIYELKHNGRENANKLIIFITDGIIDTGDRARDIERQKWLESQLADESEAEGIRIFGIAFTEKADFQLIQTLGQKTGGDYYRVYRAEDIQGVFNSINETISKPEPEPEHVQQQPIVVEPPKIVPPEKEFPLKLLVVGVVCLLVLGIVPVVLISMRRGKSGIISRHAKIPEACLVDQRNVTGNKTYKIDKKVTTIGRVKGDHVDISIDKETISAIHARIEYKNHNFYITDLDSLNGTFLNDSQERISGEAPLKNGDVISFHQHRFRFAVSEQGERGGMVSAQLRGGTVMYVPGISRSFSPQPGDQEVLLVAPSHDKPPSSLSKYKKSQAGRKKLKPIMCPNHPNLHAKELCPVCKEARCENCMVEKDGMMICSECASRSVSEKPVHVPATWT